MIACDIWDRIFSQFSLLPVAEQTRCAAVWVCLQVDTQALSESVTTFLFILIMSSPVELYVYDLSNGMARQLSVQLTGRQIDGIWYTLLSYYHLHPSLNLV
jgi:hypothetical protein